MILRSSQPYDTSKNKNKKEEEEAKRIQISKRQQQENHEIFKNLDIKELTSSIQFMNTAGSAFNLNNSFIRE